MLYFNSCPRCKSGTIQLESDFFGSYLSCLNCGFEKSAASVRELNYEEAKREAEEVVAAANAKAVAVDDGLSHDDIDADDLEFAEQAAG